MPRAFEITSPASSLSLDAAGKGDVTFAITNQLDHATRVRASIVPDGAIKPEWLSLVEAVKNVNPKQTETFTVRVAVPAGTAPGDYSFKIVAASEANPEEESTEGPSVKFHVGPTARKKLLWLWIAVAAAAVVLLGVGAYFLFRPHRPSSHLGQSCTTDANCATAEKCSDLPSSGKVCLLRPGQRCETDLNCSSFWCIEDKKICSKDDGSCESDADCRGDSFLCTPNKVCLKKIGQQCTASTECATGNCQGNVCRPAISPCVPSCPARQFCVDGTCKPILIRPGTFRFAREGIPIVVPIPHR